MMFLVVDDSKLARLSLIKTLKEHEPSADVIEAENGALALEAFKEHRPKVVFLDLTMPVMDGYEALKHLLSMEPKLQVIVVTADIQTQAKEQVLASGAKMVVPKPISSEKMQMILQELLL